MSPDFLTLCWRSSLMRIKAMLYKPLRIPLQEFIPSYTALTSRVFTVQNAVKRAARAPRLRSAVLMFNLLYVHMYGMARKDLTRQLGGMCENKVQS